MSTLLQVFFNYCLTSVLDKTVSGEGGNGEWGMGNGEWGTGNGERGMGNGEWGKREQDAPTMENC